MRSWFKNGLAILAVVLLAPSMASAQAILAGEVSDTSGAVLPGVTVEATSPVLIEGVRATVTDGTGRYQIVNLRPGTYTVTFVLPGFATVSQEGIQLTGTATTNVNVQMRVGGLEETVTVTGEAPIVDVTTTTRQQVLDAETINALPTARNYLTLARLNPAASGGGSDVGGSMLQDVGGSVTIHGSRAQDQRVTLNGINTMTLQAGGNIGGQIPDVASAAEITIEHTAVSAEMAAGGVRINFIPRDGGNTFSGTTFFTFSNTSLQGDNFSQELQDAGLPTPNQVKLNWDLNPAAGGPIVQDKLWFFISTHFNQVQNYAAIFNNANAQNPQEWLYVADESQRGLSEGRTTQSSLRLTWQATPRNKIAGTYKVDRWCNCPDDRISATVSPEASVDRRFPRLRQEHLEWTSPVNNNVLLEAVGMHLFERWGNMHLRSDGWGASLDTPAQAAAQREMISVSEQSSGLLYRSATNFNNTLVPNYAFRAAATYVTGTHNFKVGVNQTNGFVDVKTYNFQNLSYRFNNGVPNRITLLNTPRDAKSVLDADFGLFAQDTMTFDQLTIGLAIRYDRFASSFPEQELGPGPWNPDRSLTFAAQDNLGWNDLTYRSSITYDLFGNGRTALKGTVNRYLRGQTLNTWGSSPNPVNALVNSTNINWTDADGDFFPDCDLLNPAANGECRGWSNTAFGTKVPGASFDSDLLTGFGNREANWEYSAGVQHEVVNGISVDVGYFRRSWQNLSVTDNRALSADDFDYFSITVPTDARLPGGGGYTLDGFRALKQSAFGRPDDVLNTLANKYGDSIEVWQGVDVNVNGRLSNGLQFQVGTSTGRTEINDCDIASELPENNLDRAIQFCDRTEPFSTQLKGFAVYTIPTVDVQLSGTFRSTPGDFINADFTADNAFLAAHSTLGRSLAGGARNITIELLEPNTMRLDRRNELDLRIGKVLRLGGARSVISLDIFNALNNDARLSVNQNYASWLSPTEILNARLLKVSFQLDF